MKNITFSIIAVLFITVNVFAQAPQKMSYQAVIRNNSSALITTAPVGMKISILQGSSTGIPVYTETHTPTTNSNGLVSLEIGTGTIISGTFSSINWANGPYFIKTETDPSGGNSYTISGTSELMSVPYALFSANGTPGPQGPVGATGAQGPAGTNGLDGISAYQVWLNLGNTGTQTDFINSLTGPIGLTGPVGPTGTFNYTFLSKTANYTITSSDVTNNLILVNTSSGVITITLPSASAVGAGKNIYLSGSNIAVYQSLNVLCPAGNTFLGVYFNGTQTSTNATLGSSITWIQLVSDGVSKWYVTGLYF
jgi:hypothetical protein